MLTQEIGDLRKAKYSALGGYLSCNMVLKEGIREDDRKNLAELGRELENLEGMSAVYLHDAIEKATLNRVDVSDIALLLRHICTPPFAGCANYIRGTFKTAAAIIGERIAVAQGF